MALPVFVAYFGVLWIDEISYHRKRAPLARVEKMIHPLQTFFILLLFGFVLKFSYGSHATFWFGALAVLTTLMIAADAPFHVEKVSAAEHLLHSVVFLLHPAMVMILAMCWRFVDGASFFMGVVLPFNTGGLRLLCSGFAVVTALLFAYQVFYWNFRRHASTDETVILPVENALTQINRETEKNRAS